MLILFHREILGTGHGQGGAMDMVHRLLMLVILVSGTEPKYLCVSSACRSIITRKKRKVKIIKVMISHFNGELHDMKARDL